MCPNHRRARLALALIGASAVALALIGASTVALALIGTSTVALKVGALALLGASTVTLKVGALALVGTSTGIGGIEPRATLLLIRSTVEVWAATIATWALAARKLRLIGG